MESKRQLSGLFLPQQIKHDRHQRQEKNTSRLSLCRICGDKARFFNYGALSCSSCKTFFRRHSSQFKCKHRCKFNGSCQINIKTRRKCCACRLAKCLSMGMNSDFIRKEALKTVKCSSATRPDKHQDVSFRQSIFVSEPSTINLSYHDRCRLNDFQWRLLSHILHTLDAYSTISPRYQALENVATPLLELHDNVISPFHIIIQMYKSLELFIGPSLDFPILNVDEKYSLIDRNLHGIMAFFLTLFYRDTGILLSPECMTVFINEYDRQNMLQTMHFHDAQLCLDATIIKLIFIVFTFSTNCFVVNAYENMQYDSLLYHSFHLLESQNVYVELLWKYMIYQNGYYQTILYFSRIINVLLSVQKAWMLAYTYDRVHHTRISKIIDGAKQLILGSF